jgi:hypothetical protein
VIGNREIGEVRGKGREERWVKVLLVDEWCGEVRG